MWVRWLEDLGESDVTVAGRKAVTLAMLRRAELPVLPGVVVTTAAFEQWRANEPIRTLAARTSRIDGRDAALNTPNSLAGVQVPEASVPAAVASALLMAVDRLSPDVPAGRWVVRSSATAEDMPSASFAGLYRSLLNVPADALLDAVRDVWASFWTPQAIAFRRKAQLDDDDASMAVLVQPFVPTDISGVVFTCSPLSGERDRFVVSSSWGLGEACVGGWTEPDTLVISRTDQTVEEKYEGSKVVMAVPASNGHGTRRQATPTALRQRFSLVEDQWRLLISAAVRIEDLLGSAQDIEWGWTANELFIFQSRPVTPLLVSLDDWELNRSPAQKQLDRAAATFCKGARRQYAPEERDREAVALRQHWEEVLVPTFNEAFHKLDDVLARAARSAEDDNRSAAAGQMLVAFESAVATYKDHFCRLIEAGDLVAASLEKLGISTSMRALRQEQLSLLQDQQNLHLSWRDAIEELVEALNADDTVRAIIVHPDTDVHELLNTLAATPVGRHWKQTFEEFVNTYGHVSFPGYDVASPTLAEQPELILHIIRTKLIATALQAQASGASDPTRGDAEPPVADPSQLDGNRLNTHGNWLAVAQRNFPIRQATDHYYYITQNYVRRAFLLVGAWLTRQGLIPAGDDVFFLGLKRTIVALTDLVEGIALDGSELVRAINHNRRELIEREHSPGAHAVAAFQHLCLEETNGGRTIHGVACSPGIASGPARIIHTATDLGAMEAGDILVASQITPSWTPFFLAAGGVVTDIGGVLSHGAIIARECGVPTVVGARLATRLIKPGEQVTVDGTRGVVVLSCT